MEHLFSGIVYTLITIAWLWGEITTDTFVIASIVFAVGSEIVITLKK